MNIFGRRHFLLIMIMGLLSGMATADMRRCLLLPVMDNLQGATSYKVFEGLERYLKEGDWCYYRSNAEILDILGQYRQNLEAHLENPDILRVISERTGAGSLIRVTVFHDKGQIKLKLTILGANGEDVYFQEESTIPGEDLNVAVRTLQNWLEAYRKRLPYDGTLVAILGDQFTLKIGQEYGVRPGMEVEIYRSTGMEKHPLLKEVVGWPKKLVGRAKILAVADESSQGQMLQYQEGQKIQLGDWALLVQQEKVEIVSGKEPLPAKDKHQDHFGKLGQVGIHLNLGSGDGKFSTKNNKMNFSGLTFGVGINVELWATRNWWAGLDYDYNHSNYKRDSGMTPTESLMTSTSRFKIRAGFRYLPLNYYFGPRIDAYLGYAHYWYRLPTAREEIGMGEVAYRGALAGVKGDIPFLPKTRLYLRLEALIFDARLVEKHAFYGKADRVMSYDLEFGGSYEFATGWTGELSADYTANEAKINSFSHIDFHEVLLKVGTNFIF